MNITDEFDFYNKYAHLLEKLKNNENFTHGLGDLESWAVLRNRPKDVWDYLEIIMGPRRGPIGAVVTVTCIYGFIFLSGIFGNVCTCIVIMKNKYMHTATNYYLFNLAVADLLLLLVGLPLETYYIWYQYPWIFGEAVCVGRTLIAEMCTNASIFTITAFTIER